MSHHLRLKALEEVSSRPSFTPVEKFKNPIEEFADDVFTQQELQLRLPGSSFKEFLDVLKSGGKLSANLADQIASAMKDWAIHKGATHFTHWFQPQTGLTAEKHDSFISFGGGWNAKSVIMNFTGKELIKGEPDASSFPSGGIRSTFEARGYTAWDPTSPAFIRRGPAGNFLCIPTAFCSWTGEALDWKTPLLRSESALSRATVRLLRLIGQKDVAYAISNLGCEQEYFAIDKAFYYARPDLVATGRTLLGARPPKGQELEDHYFGSLDKRVLAFMQETEWNLWRLGIPAKTRHNEVAPSQYETAPIFEQFAVASDHNMLVMDVTREIAKKHNLIALFHEKPFAGVNGSGKHNNWSIQTDTGDNLLEPGKTPLQNTRFLLFLAAIIRAVSEHGDLLRIAVAVPGNDHRLGANEAPPAIMSAYVGDELLTVINTLTEAPSPSTKGKNEPAIHLGVSTLPAIPKETSDRNRTSPFAFTGNKFEFRAVGSSQACARPGMILNSITADAVNKVADELEEALKTEKDVNLAVTKVVVANLKAHKRAMFNGNGYSQEWVKEAEQRGLPNLRTLPEAVQQMCSEKNVQLFERVNVLSSTELHAQQHIAYENFIKVINIEAESLHSLATTSVLPVALEFKAKVAADVTAGSQLVSSEELSTQKKFFASVNSKVTELIDSTQALRVAIQKAKQFDESQIHEQATFYRKEVTEAANRVRDVCDALELVVDDRLWPLPKYSEILFLK